MGEPLAGLLRDPRMVCETKGQVFHMYVDWLLLADNQVLPLAPSGSRSLLFDVGGSRFPEALQFLVAEYASRGVVFDEILVWEAKRQGNVTYWAGAPEALREMYELHLTLFDGVSVTAEVGGHENPITHILERCHEEDFCVFKLDIDKPTLERELAAQVLKQTQRLG